MVQGTSEAVSKLGEPLTKWDLQALKRRDQMWNYLGMALTYSKDSGTPALACRGTLHMY
jgi:hypothetical protein